MARILVIDDSEMVRQSICLALGRAGHAIEAAPDGVAGVNKFVAGSYDVVISDVFMPNADGISTVRTIRDRDARVGIITISGSGQDGGSDFLRMTTELGADYALRKPFSNNDLLATVAKAAAKRDERSH